LAYEVALEPSDVIERLSSAEGVAAYPSASLPEYGRISAADAFTVEVVSDVEFRVHVGPPAARGQTGTGVRRLLYLRGSVTPSERGARVELVFSYGRPRWAVQRWFGFLLTWSLGIAWLFVGSGEFALRAALLAVFALFTGPVVVHDLALGRRRRSLAPPGGVAIIVAPPAIVAPPGGLATRPAQRCPVAAGAA
jgi:hypothetical protein